MRPLLRGWVGVWDGMGWCGMGRGYAPLDPSPPPTSRRLYNNLHKPPMYKTSRHPGLLDARIRVPVYPFSPARLGWGVWVVRGRMWHG